MIELSKVSPSLDAHTLIRPRLIAKHRDIESGCISSEAISRD